MSSILSKITSTLSGDVAFLITMFVVLFLLALYFGKNRFASLVLAFYPAIFLYNSLPFLSKLIVLSGDRGITINKVGIFLVLFVLVNLAIRKYVFLYDESSSAVSKGALALAVLILILIFSYTTVSLDTFHNFSGQIDSLFAGTTLIFWWGIAPLVILAFV